MLNLPPASHPVNEMFELSDLENWATLKDAKQIASKSFAPGVRSVNIMVLSCQDVLRLVKFGPRGGRTTLWNFGPLH